MKTLQVRVNNKIATYSSRGGGIVCGNTDYQIEFIFDSEWDGTEEKTARFIWNGKYVDVKFLGTICPVPCISNAYTVEVGVFSSGVCTSTGAVIPCTKSILCGSSTLPEGPVISLLLQEKTAKENGEVTPDSGYGGLSRVTVDVPQPKGIIELNKNGDHVVKDYAVARVAVPAPSGSINLTYNGEHDVKDYETAVVSVPQPSGSINLTYNGEHDVKDYETALVSVDEPVGNVVLNANGTHDVKAYATVKVAVTKSKNDLMALIDRSVTSIEIPEGVTKIGGNSFNYCDKLTSVIIPSSVTNIATAAFSSCKALKSVTCYAQDPPTLQSSALSGVPDACSIYVPAESVDRYKSTTNWSARADYIKPIQDTPLTGTYYFNANVSGKDIDESVTFTLNGETFTGIKFNGGRGELAYINNGAETWVKPDMDTTWVDEAYKTITFDTQMVSSYFYEWLMDNGTLEGHSVLQGTYRFKENMTFSDQVIIEQVNFISDDEEFTAMELNPVLIQLTYHGAGQITPFEGMRAGWTHNDVYRTVEFTKQFVSTDFFNWLTTSTEEEVTE